MDHSKSLYWSCYNIASVVYVLIFQLWGKWALSCLTRDQTCTPCPGRQSLNHWTAREVPQRPSFNKQRMCIGSRLFFKVSMKIRKTIIKKKNPFLLDNGDISNLMIALVFYQFLKLSHCFETVNHNCMTSHSFRTVRIIIILCSYEKNYMAGEKRRLSCSYTLSASASVR